MICSVYNPPPYVGFQLYKGDIKEGMYILFTVYLQCLVQYLASNKPLIKFFWKKLSCYLVKAMVFPVVMYGCELDCEESWAPKNWCFWTVVLEKTLESPLDCRVIQPVHSEGDRPWDFFGENDAEAETPVLWPPHEKSWLIRKDSDAGMDWGQEEKGTTKDKMAGWHHGLDGCESEWTPGVGDGQGSLACCDSWGCKESDMTEWLN